MATKRENELEIFKLFCGKLIPHEYEHQDRPDFWVTGIHGLKYGVEITELFDNESEARLAKIPNYIDELFDNKGVRHKDDKETLKIREITLLSPDNVHVAKVPALMYEDTDVNLYISKLINRIKEKDIQSRGYNGDLVHHSMIIRDHSHALVGRERKDLYSLIYKKPLIEALTQSNFKEIYLIRHDKDGYYHTPLKGFLFLSRLYFFHDLLVTMQVACNEMEFHNYFAELLQFQGFKDVQLLMTPDKVDVVYGNYGIGVRNLKSIEIQDLSEVRDLVQKLSMIEKSSFLSEEMVKCIASLEKTFGIEGEFSFKLERSTISNA